MDPLIFSHGTPLYMILKSTSLIWRHDCHSLVEYLMPFLLPGLFLLIRFISSRGKPVKCFFNMSTLFEMRFFFWSSVMINLIESTLPPSRRFFCCDVFNFFLSLMILLLLFVKSACTFDADNDNGKFSSIVLLLTGFSVEVSSLFAGGLRCCST